MAGPGGEEIDEKVAEAMLKRLESESNGAKLSVFMVDALMAQIGPTVASVEEVAGLTNKDIEEEFEEAWIHNAVARPVERAFERTYFKVQAPSGAPRARR